MKLRSTDLTLSNSLRHSIKIFASLLLVVASLSQITVPANAAVEPIDFQTLSVCSDSYAINQIAICVPKGENYVAKLSATYSRLGFSQNIVSGDKVIAQLTKSPIDLSQFAAADYLWQVFSGSTTNAQDLIRKVKFKVVDLTMQSPVAKGSNQSIEATFQESYVLSYEDKSLISALTTEFGVSTKNLEPEILISSAKGRQIVSDSGRKLVQIGLTKNQLTLLANDKRVINIEKNMMRSVSATTQNSAPWNLDRLDQDGPSLNNSFTYETGATTPVIYVLDTGLNLTHTEFSNRVANCWWFTYLTSSCTDYEGHGTHVSGTALGTKYGVAKNAQLEFFKITNDNGGTNSYYIALALKAVWDQISLDHPNQPGVLNLSFGCSPYCSTSYSEAYYFHQLVLDNIMPVVAAGNDTWDSCDTSFGDLGGDPYDYAIVVGATYINGSRDEISWYSNFGPCVTIFAPGGSGYTGDTARAIASAGTTSNTSVAYMSGTSMASPLVAGVIANYLSVYPTKTFAQIHDWLLAKARINKIDGLPGDTVNKLVSIHQAAAAQTIAFSPPTSLSLAQSPYSLTATA
jgi:subtilisin family serine protease